MVQYRQVKEKAFQTAAQIIVKAENPTGYFLQNQYHQEDSKAVFVSVVPFTKKHDKFDLSCVTMPLKYPHERLLDPKMIGDLKLLLPYMGDYCQWILDLEERQKEIARTSATTSTSVGDENADDYELKPDEKNEYDHGDRNFDYAQKVEYKTRSRVKSKK